MPMLYIHVPFCESRCIYCDFYSTTCRSEEDRYISAAIREMQARAGELKDAPLRTVYIGGGTPSVLKPQSLQHIFAAIEKTFDISACSEITLEVNPDDITPAYIKELRKTPVTRISMGVQSLDDGILKFLRRRHDASGAEKAYTMLRQAGYNNISIDLIYSIPGQSMETWNATLDKALAMRPEHISAYDLSYEDGTPLTRLLEQEMVEACGEDDTIAMYALLNKKLEAAGYARYEISNFAREGYHSRHNSGYWRGEPYLGIGASSHSFDGGNVRRANVADLQTYIAEIEAGRCAYRSETLTPGQQYDETIYIRLRTADGIDTEEIRRRFGDGCYRHMMKNARPYIERGVLVRDGTRLRLGESGIMLCDAVCRTLFL